MKIRILKKLQLTPHPSRDEVFVLINNFYVEVDGLRWKVPTGFSTDGASIPRAWWGELPPWGAVYSEAAVMHDYFYSKSERAKLPYGTRPTRKYADNVFYEMIKNKIKTDKNAPSYQARMMWLAVRIGGFFGWRK